MLVTQGSTDALLNRHRRGLPPRRSESDIRPLSTFSSSILYIPLIVPARSHNSVTKPIANINHKEPPL
jgi:hypothetical protein